MTHHSPWHIIKDIRYLPQEHQCESKCVCAANSIAHNVLVSTVAVNEAGDTPLSLACSGGDLEIVKALINKDVDPKSKCLSVTVMLLMVIFHRASQQGW